MNTGIINNPLTDKTVKSHFGKDSYLEMVSFWENTKSADAQLVSRASLGITSGSEDTETWTPIIWELDGNNEIADKQADIICEFIANPDYVFEKSQGGGRPPTRNIIKGKRELHYVKHFDPANNHLHTLHFNYSVSPNGTVNNMDNIARRSEAKGAFIAEINRRLEEANLPKIGSFMLNLKQKEHKASETTKAKVIEAVEEVKTFEEYREEVAKTFQVNPVAINDELNRLQAEFALVEEQQKKRLQTLQQLREANEVALKYNVLVEETQKQRQEIEELNNSVISLNAKNSELAEKVQGLETDYATINEELQQEQTLNSSLNQQLQQEKANSSNLSQQLQQEQANNASLNQQLQQLQQANSSLNQQLQQEQANNASLNQQLQQAQALNAQYQQMFNDLKEQVADIKAENADLKATITPMAQKVQSLETANRKLGQENQTLAKIVESVTPLFEQIRTMQKELKQFVKTLFKSKPELKNEDDIKSNLDSIVKASDSVVKDLTPAQKKMAEMLARKEKEKKEEQKENSVIPPAQQPAIKPPQKN